MYFLGLGNGQTGHSSAGGEAWHCSGRVAGVPGGLGGHTGLGCTILPLEPLSFDFPLEQSTYLGTLTFFWGTLMVQFRAPMRLRPSFCSQRWPHARAFFKPHVSPCHPLEFTVWRRNLRPLDFCFTIRHLHFPPEHF